MRSLQELLMPLVEYRVYFAYGAGAIAIIVTAILLIGTVRHIHEIIEEENKNTDKDALKNTDYATLRERQRAGMLRQIIAPDAVDPGPNSYLIINDGGKDIYVRSFSIAKMPGRTIFANTFSQIMDFPNCTSSIFINPISEAAMSHKMDRHITVLAAEYMGSNGDINRQRKLNAQFQETNRWAEAVESGENRFFDVGFVFTLQAEDLSTLNKITDTFHSKALQKSIYITNCYAVQAEAFLANAPLNNMVRIGSRYITSNCIQTFQMDKYSASTLFNYTQSSFSHKEGIALGRNMFTADPVIYDMFDPSHDGFTILVAGKTGCGKSVTIKIWVSRALAHGYHFVSIDSQARRGMSEGEYAGIAELADGVNFMISTKSKEIMNIFDISESTRQQKISATQFREVKTLELADKISMVVFTLSSMIQGSKEYDSLEAQTYISRILADEVTFLYNSFGIIDGKPETLYKDGDYIKNGELLTGKVPKELPTITDFYKHVLIANMKNPDPTLASSYNIILMALKDYVKELYYSENSCTFFTEEEYRRLPFMTGSNMREFQNPKTKRKERVIEIKGIKPYYDGQSTVHISRECSFTNIDISQLPDNERKLARQIAIEFVNESFIKKNSESIESADKLAVIIDEAHESFAYEFMRKTLDGSVRTARKRHVGIVMCTQTIKEYSQYPETEAILTQAAAKFVFKQDYQHKQYLMDTLGITESQAEYIVTTLGGNVADDADRSRHRGEMCIIDNQQVCFCKVDMLKRTEALPAETDAAEIERLITTYRAS